ncbi:hypothetical protein PPGU19_083060 (plasmid) [Paraburkholderia sp. PGU19]|nr:hypothetical protein PPGU19_083060 [Paraburkholderia sp. PGU19]
MPSFEFNIHPPPALASSEIVDALREVMTPHISDSLQRVSGVVGLTRYHRSGKLVGTAFTVKTRPGDNLLLYKALMDMSPGHVLVVEIFSWDRGDPRRPLNVGGFNRSMHHNDRCVSSGSVANETAPAEQSPTPHLVTQFCANVDVEGSAIDYWS